MNAPLPVKLMLVEDERLVAFDLKRQLQSFGYQVSAVVASGEEAVSRSALDAPDLVLMDIHLEGAMDGIDAATRIQTAQRIPVVFLTAYAEDGTLRRALESRPFGYLVKPCEARELHATIQMALERRKVEVAVERSELRLKLALEAASMSVLEWYPGSNEFHVDGCLDGLFGKTPRTVDETWDDFLARVHPADLEQVVAKLESALADGDAVRIEFRTRPSGGLPRFLEAHARAYDGSSMGLRVVGMVQDVTRRHLDEERLRKSSVVFQTAAEAIVVSNAARRIEAVNGAFQRITGYREEEARDADLDSLLAVSRRSDPYALLTDPAGEGYWQGEALCRRAGGEPFPSWQSMSVVRDPAGAVSHYIIAFSDITPIHLAEERLAHLAHHDVLTGLPNRLLFDYRFEHVLDQAQRQGGTCLLLFLDLDSFKVVNDTLGHLVGDELLRLVADRLRALMRRSDTVARLGGDEFVVLAENAGADYGARLAERILQSLAEPARLADQEITTTASIGIAVYPDDGADRHALMRAADLAMYAAKTRGRDGYRFYTRELADRSDERMHLEQGLRRAILGGALAVHYQPQVDLASGLVTGVEALVRWPHPDAALVPPARFIPIAEESGVIEALGRWVLERACRDVAGMVDGTGHPLRLAVNVSARQFAREGFIDMVRDTLAASGFPAAALELEITESTLQVAERSAAILRGLRALGVSASIDDFGTGYSSLGVLRGLPVARIKIDRSFVHGLPGDPGASAIVQAVLALARALELGVVAEGIERTGQARRLAELGCAEGQGFLYSRPLDHAALVRLLAGGGGYLHPRDDAEPDAG